MTSHDSEIKTYKMRSNIFVTNCEKNINASSGHEENQTQSETDKEN